MSAVSTPQQTPAEPTDTASGGEAGYVAPTMGFRWMRPGTGGVDNTDRLQQAWIWYMTGEIEWRDVPIVVVGAKVFTPPNGSEADTGSGGA